MKKLRYIFRLKYGFLIGIFCIAPMAEAGLGEFADSINADLPSSSAVRNRAETRDHYTIEKLQSKSAAIREFVNSDGIVFGVTWKGSTPPNLNKLLGSYFKEYQRTMSQISQKPGRGSRKIKSSELVVEHWGHMRSYQGRAYVTSLIPSGVSLDEIR